MGISLSSQMIDGADVRIDNRSTNKEGAIDTSLGGAVYGLDDQEDDGSDDGVDGEVVIDVIDSGLHVNEGDMELEGDGEDGNDVGDVEFDDGVDDSVDDVTGSDEGVIKGLVNNVGVDDGHPLP